MVREILHPLEIQSLHADGRQVSLSLTNHADKAIVCSVEGRPVTLAGHTAQTVTFTVAGTSPFEAREVSVVSEGLPPVRRTAFICDDRAAGDWVKMTGGGVVLQVARDGSGARIELDGKLVGFIAPLVWRDGVVPKLKLVGEGDTLKFRGDGVSVTLSKRGTSPPWPRAAS